MITRREFARLAAAMGASTLMAGCAERGAGEADDATVEVPASPASDAAGEGQAELEVPSPGPSAIVVFFSRVGENYNVGVVDEGNTAVVAKMIAERTGADTFEIVPVVAYPEGYDDCCDVALAEKNEGARPEVEALPDLSAFDIVFFGFPVWWGDIPMPVYTAIEALDWNGKTICPFNTHEGSGEAGMFATLAQVCAGATVTEGLTLRGQDAQNDREGTQAAVDAWLEGLGQ